MIINNSADAINYGTQVIEDLIKLEEIDYDKVRDAVISLMMLEQYLVLMEQEKRNAKLAVDGGLPKSIYCYKACFNMWKRNAETELRIIDRILEPDKDDAE